MNKITFLKNRLLDLCKGIYSPPDAEMAGIYLGRDDRELLAIAGLNRLDHLLALNTGPEDESAPEIAERIALIREEYRLYAEKLRQALKLVSDALSGEPFIIIKTVSLFPHLTHDLDVIVHDLGLADRIPTREFFPDGSTHLATDEKEDELKNRLLLHLGIDITWTGLKAISDSFLWSGLRRTSFAGIEFSIPSSRCDILLRLGHMAFEIAHVRLGELLHIYRLAEEVDWRELEREAEKMGWPRTFSRMATLLGELHYRLFGVPFPPLEPGTRPDLKPEEIIFPVELPFRLLAAGVIEKKAWKKIHGAKYIIKDRLIRWRKRIFH